MEAYWLAPMPPLMYLLGVAPTLCLSAQGSTERSGWGNFSMQYGTLPADKHQKGSGLADVASDCVGRTWAVLADALLLPPMHLLHAGCGDDNYNFNYLISTIISC